MEKLVSGAARLGIGLEGGQLDRFEVYCREMLDWNRRLNLTSITGYEDIQVNHFLDALTVTLAWQPGASGTAPRVIDIGAGAGIPGIPLKLAFPSIRLTLLESTGKKTRFLHHLIQALHLSDVEVVTGRAEDAGRDRQYREVFDLALARAVAALPALAELALPFCAVGGLAVLHKRGDIAAELARAEGAIGILGGELREVRTVDMPEFPDRRRLVVLQKTSPTPARYPRRPGAPAKRPLV
jgi:16S rRNA (guanine527-N7)-methyltransferase